MATRTRQIDLVFKTWGGKRAGAGRKRAPGARPNVSRRKRPVFRPEHPVHVTLRAVTGLPSFRDERAFIAFREALRAASRSSFRIVHFSVQSNHLHLLVEADEAKSLTRGVQGLAIRAAKAINRLIGRRGKVWGDRYHARALPTPREVRNAIVYVLNNFRKHVPAAKGLDSRSSSAWFSGWRAVVRPSLGSSPVAPARTWLARIGWRRYGPIDLDEVPRRS